MAASRHLRCQSGSSHLVSNITGYFCNRVGVCRPCLALSLCPGVAQASAKSFSTGTMPLDTDLERDGSARWTVPIPTPSWRAIVRKCLHFRQGIDELLEAPGVALSAYATTWT